MITTDAVSEIAQKYYDSSDANGFYLNVWGGEDIHVGIYAAKDEEVARASRRTVEKMVTLLPKLNSRSKVLDIGSGFGGSARYLAKSFGCHVDCLNISTEQNNYNRELVEQAALSKKVTVTEGSFEHLPYKDIHFDVVWCQDAILHSGQKQKVFAEVQRVLKPGGVFLFTDPMQDENATAIELRPVLDRIHLDSLGSVTAYRQLANEVGLRDYFFNDQSRHLSTHYSRILEELNARGPNLVRDGKCSPDYIEGMKAGLEHWITAGKSGKLRWGIMRFTK